MITAVLLSLFLIAAGVGIITIMVNKFGAVEFALLPPDEFSFGIVNRKWETEDYELLKTFEIFVLFFSITIYLN